MKYWRGYLVALILFVCTWAIKEFAQSHQQLVDMVYPYVSRMGQTSLAEWSGGVSYNLWQTLALFLAAGFFTTVVLMIVLHWNPIQWLGWILAASCFISLLSTGIYGLNQHSVPLAEDIHLTVSEYSLAELKGAATYFRDLANAAAPTAERDSGEGSHTADFDTLANAAGEGFENLTKKQYLSVFAGSVVPVKKLPRADHYAAQGVTGIHKPLTGEAAVNPKTPAAGLPFAMCEQMARRMCISNDQDAVLAAFLACRANTRAEFQYSGYFMAYRYCMNTLKSYNDPEFLAAVAELEAGESAYLKQDLKEYEKSFAKRADHPYTSSSQHYNVTDLLVSLYIKEIILPQQVEEEKIFDPTDETQVDLTGLPNAKVPANG